MVHFKLTESDKTWLVTYFPNLRFAENKGTETIVGPLEFDAYYDKTQDIFIHFPNDDYTGKYRIQDNYDVQIELVSSDFSILPQVKEIGGRIKQLGKQKKIPLYELHINDDGTACLSGKYDQQEFYNKGFILKDFFYKMIIPFFYDQSFYEKYNEWPRDWWSHGVQGEIRNLIQRVPFLQKYIKDPQSYQRLMKLLEAKKVRKEWPCICGSNKRFVDCHMDFFVFTRSVNFRKLKQFYKKR